MKKGKEKRWKITLKRGKGLKNASFWAIIKKKSPRPPQTYLSGKKINLKRWGWGNDQNEQYISLELCDIWKPDTSKNGKKLILI